MMIDIFTHIMPPKYVTALEKKAAAGKISSSLAGSRARRGGSAMIDIGLRLRALDEFPDMMQVLTMMSPPLEAIARPEDVVDLARIANDEMAEIVARHPDRFVAVASLPMNDMDAALREVDRAIVDLKLRGVQLYTSVNHKPLDSPEFLPLYEKMSQYDLPIWLHPVKDLTEPDYSGEDGSKFGLAAMIGWPHVTSMAMIRLSGSGILEKFPDLKFITHHAGGTVPYLASRIEFYPFKYENLPKPIIYYLRLFYNDTAVQGNTANLNCAYTFCGADHLLFGTDFIAGVGMVGAVIRSINEMTIPEADKEKIFAGNARRLLNLTV